MTRTQKREISIALICVVATIMAIMMMNITLKFFPKEYKSYLIECIDKSKQPYGTTTVDFNNSVQTASLCKETTLAQLNIDEQVVRRDNFVFQRYENAMLLFMVIFITMSGVIFAGLQLLASYKLAMAGKRDISPNSELSYANASFRTSVVGLMILAISFGFFLVFVNGVYTLKEEGNKKSHPGGALTQNSNGILMLPQGRILDIKKSNPKSSNPLSEKTDGTKDTNSKPQHQEAILNH